jgi:hypothetical protein
MRLPRTQRRPPARCDFEIDAAYAGTGHALENDAQCNACPAPKLLLSPIAGKARRANDIRCSQPRRARFFRFEEGTRSIKIDENDFKI